MITLALPYSVLREEEWQLSFLTCLQIYVYTNTYTHVCMYIHISFYLLKLILCTFYSIYFYTIFLFFTTSP